MNPYMPNVFAWITGFCSLANESDFFKLKSLWIERMKIVAGDNISVKDGKLLNSGDNPTHKVITLEGTLSDSKHRITLESLSTHLIEIIDL